MSRPKQVALIIVGIMACIVAVAGAVLPGLPATPFGLVAIWAFSASSPRIYKRLSTIPILKTVLAQAENYQQHRTISPKIKAIAQISAWGSVALVVVAGTKILFLPIALAAAACSWFMVRAKSSV